MKNIRKMHNVILIVILGILLGFILLLLAYLLPASRMKSNVEKSTYSFYMEGTYRRIIDKYESTKLDNYTDAIMLESAMYDGNESIIEKVMDVYRYNNNEEGSPSEQLVKYFSKDDIQWDRVSYHNYWHGYLLVLKPMLLFFDYADIRMINIAAQFALLIIIAYLLTKRNLGKFIFPFFTSILVIMPITVSLSLQFSTIFYIFIIAIIIMLLFHEKLKERYIYFFLILGMITSFMDFLTTPILTLGMPIVLLIILNKNNWKEDIKDIIKLCVAWGIGYAGMWVGKWILSSILLNRNVMEEAFNKILQRTGNQTSQGSFSWDLVLRRNIDMVITIPNIIIIGINLLKGLYELCKNKVWKEKKSFLKLIPFIFIASMPFAWYLFAKNHSMIHYWFTYRGLAMTIFSILTGIVVITSKGYTNPKEIANK